MKRFVIMLLTLAIVAFTADAAEPAETHCNAYPEIAYVTDIDYECDIITFTMIANGEQYQCEGIEDWEIGDLAAMMMCDNGTETIYDDAVIMAHYQGSF